jgi:TonB family protein
VYIVIAFAQPPLMRAQDAVSRVFPEPTILPELSKRTGPEPLKAQGTPIPDREKPSLEVLGGAPSEKPAPIVKQERPNAEAIPVAAAEKKTPPAKHPIVQLTAPEPVSPMSLTLSALRALATKTPVPEYPYQAKQARVRVTGSGICNLVIDSTNGRVTSATMAQSTGSRLLDKVTTDTFRKWRFKPGTLSQVRVPITYE